jgi:mannose-6-phosphate isomerase-like protein (cupin superfamily)
MLQALYDDLYHLPIMKKNTGKIIDRFANGRHSGLELMRNGKGHIIVKIIEYFPYAGFTKTIMKKTTANASISSLFASGDELVEKLSPFDNYIQIIEGTVEVVINDKKYKLRLGEGIVIPAHASHRFKANEQFKMISTTIKGCYED